MDVGTSFKLAAEGVPKRIGEKKTGRVPPDFLSLFRFFKLARGYAGSSLGRRVFERWSSSDRNALKASGAWPR